MATGHLNNVEGFIKAITSYGGEDYPQFEEWYTPQNEILFQEWMKDQPKVEVVTLYRGYTFDRMYFEASNFKVGDVVGVDALTQLSFPSFTTSIMRASMYTNEFGETGLSDTVKVLFVVHTSGMGFVDVSQLSYYPEEKEFKCGNDTYFRVKSVERKAGYYKIELIESIN